eukprot:3389022-Rhodomonas_salina.2
MPADRSPQYQCEAWVLLPAGSISVPNIAEVDTTDRGRGNCEESGGSLPAEMSDMLCSPLADIHPSAPDSTSA